MQLKSRVKRVRVIKHERRVFLLIIHQQENFVEVREVMPQTGRADPYIQFVLTHMDHNTQEMLSLEDVHLL